MAENKLLEEYLARAAHAEEVANKLDEPFPKQSWLAIAYNYRELAKLQATISYSMRP